MTILKLVGRPRQFDQASVLDAAAAVFRRRGFTATSVDHLVEATGVHRGSLYAAFGSKHGLFLQVLDAVATPDTDPTERLDLLLVALVELAPTDPRVRDRVGAMARDHTITGAELGRRMLARALLADHEPDHEKETS